MLDAAAHMPGQRVAARGNATSFPMPWRNILLHLKVLDAVERGQAAAPLMPRLGPELSDFVQILLKTHGMDSPGKLSEFVHQARVRRRVVVLLILKAKERKQKGYVQLDSDLVRMRAASLPEDGVPPEIVRLLPVDDTLDKIQVQKARSVCMDAHEQHRHSSAKHASQQCSNVFFRLLCPARPRHQ